MAQEKKKEPAEAPLNLDFGNDEDFEALQKARKRGLFGRLNSRLNDAIENGRGADRSRSAVAESAAAPKVTADDIAIRRARTVNLQKMIVPEGVIVEGSISGGSETEISGRVEGNVTVEGRLLLGPSALVTGNVRAGSCRIDGLVEGKVECTDELELGKTGRLNAEVMAGKRVNLAGVVKGNVTTPGVLRMVATCKVTGDIRARTFTMEEGATLNGTCAMRPPAQSSGEKRA